MRDSLCGTAFWPGNDENGSVHEPRLESTAELLLSYWNYSGLFLNLIMGIMVARAAVATFQELGDFAVRTRGQNCACRGYLLRDDEESAAGGQGRLPEPAARPRPGGGDR